MSDSLSLGFSNGDPFNRLDEILARTQQAGASAVGRLQEQSLASQRLGANGVDTRLQEAGSLVGSASLTPLGQRGSEATGQTLDEILISVQDEIANNQNTLLGNGTPLVHALFGGALNLVGEGIALIPGLEEASGIGTALLGRKKNASKLLDRQLDVKGLIAERDQRQFENKLALTREARISKSEKMEQDNLFAAEIRKAKRDKDSAKRKRKHEKDLAKILAAERKRSQESSQQARSGDLGAELDTRETIAGVKADQAQSSATSKAKTVKEDKDQDAADSRTGVVVPAAAEAITLLKEDAEATPGMGVIIGGPDGNSGILNMQLRGEFPIVISEDGSPALEANASDTLKRHLVNQGVKANTNDNVAPEQFVETYKGAFGIAATTLQKSLEDRSDPNTDAGKAAANEMRDFGIVQIVANDMGAQVAIEIQSILQTKENLIVAGTLLDSIFPGQGTALLTLADGEHESLADLNKAAEGPLSKILKEGQLSQILEAYAAFNQGDKSQQNLLIEAGLLKRTQIFGHRNSARPPILGAEPSALGKKIPALVEALRNIR